MTTAEPRYPFVHLDVDPDLADELSGLLFELGAEGVEERDEGTLLKNAAAGKVTLVAAFPSREEAEAAMAELGEHAPRYEEIVGDAWRDAWKEHYRPFTIARAPEGGASVVVRPPWEPYEAKAGEKVLELEPGRAFGTGLHETTRLVAQALAEHQARLAGITMFDIGCGSGVLALVALLLGADKAVAMDVDPEAIDVTRENAARNGLEARITTTTEPLAADLRSPVVVANIEAKVLIPLAADIGRHVGPGGLLLLSGILVPQKDDVRAAYPEFELLAAPTMGEWTLLALERK